MSRSVLVWLKEVVSIGLISLERGRQLTTETNNQDCFVVPVKSITCVI